MLSTLDTAESCFVFLLPQCFSVIWLYTSVFISLVSLYAVAHICFSQILVSHLVFFFSCRIFLSVSLISRSIPLRHAFSPFPPSLIRYSLHTPLPPFLSFSFPLHPSLPSTHFSTSIRIPIPPFLSISLHPLWIRPYLRLFPPPVPP